MKRYIISALSVALFIIITYSGVYYYNSLRSFEVVIARYNENLDWVAKEFPDNKVTIYNKGKNDFTALPNWKVIELPNIGRESQTYLYHIVSNYNDLADRTLFLQGNPYDHLGDVYLPLAKYKTLIFNHVSNKCRNIIARCGDAITSNIKSLYKRDRNRLDNISTYLQSMTPYLRDERKVFFRKKNDNFKNFVTETLGRKLPDSTIIGWSFGAQFAVDKEIILQHNIKHYKNLLKVLDTQNPIEGFFFEKSWDIVFDNGKYKDIENKP